LAAAGHEFKTADEADVVAEGRRHQLDRCGSRRQRLARDRRSRRSEQALALGAGHAPADDDEAGVEGVDYAHDAEGEGGARALHDGGGAAVAGALGGGDVGRVRRLQARLAAGARDART
jgi:hypothetical protein